QRPRLSRKQDQTSRHCARARRRGARTRRREPAGFTWSEVAPADRQEQVAWVRIVICPGRLVLFFTFAAIDGSTSCIRRFFSPMTAQSKDGARCGRERSSRSSAAPRFSCWLL